MNYPEIFYKTFQPKYSSSGFMTQILEFEVPDNRTAIWHLGQNSFVLKSADETIIAIDPYLTDSCGSDNNGNRTEKSRFLPVLIEPEDFDVDLILLTHSHRDHTDTSTLERLPKKDSIKFICPFQVISILRSIGIEEQNIQLLHPYEKVSCNSLEITGTFALPTDKTDLNHLGYLIDFENGTRYCNTGDTSYTELLSYLKEYNINVMSICINGGYSNLSHFEAAKITEMIDPEFVIPSHHDVMPKNYQSAEVFEYSLSKTTTRAQYKKIEYYEHFLF